MQVSSRGVSCCVALSGVMLLALPSAGMAEETRAAPAQMPMPTEVAAVRLALFRDAVDAVGAVGDALQKLTDGVTHMVTAGVSGWKYLSAQRTRDRLIDFSARSTSLVVSKQLEVVLNIETYLRGPQQDAEWQALKFSIQDAYGQVQRLAIDVRNERSDFVANGAYLKLTQSLTSRARMLSAIDKLPKPVTKSELDELERLGQQYAQLLIQAQVAIHMLNTYLNQTQNTERTPGS